MGGIDSAELNVQITGEEVESALAHARRHKAIGVDSLDPSYLHHEALIAFFNHCFISAKMPYCMEKSYNFPYPPKPGQNNKRNPLNYRGISLQSTVLKLFIDI